jgi:hypothetical protein
MILKATYVCECVCINWHWSCSLFICFALAFTVKLSSQNQDFLIQANLSTHFSYWLTGKHPQTICFTLNFIQQVHNSLNNNILVYYEKMFLIANYFAFNELLINYKWLLTDRPNYFNNFLTLAHKGISSSKHYQGSKFTTWSTDFYRQNSNITWILVFPVSAILKTQFMLKNN